MKEVFEWERMLFNELPRMFLLEVIFRTMVMFIVILVALKFTGKRGVKQLSIFETVIIIALGSAAGDPMFYEDVGLIPAVMVFVIIILMYRMVTWLIGKFKWFEELVEGKTECLIHEGQFSIASFAKESLAKDEFFSELRLKSIEHLGQVRFAFLEPSGEVSVFYYADEEVRPGLPIIPSVYNEKSTTIPADGIYACTFCGFTQGQTEGTTKALCPTCQQDEWVHAIETIRIT